MSPYGDIVRRVLHLTAYYYYGHAVLIEYGRREETVGRHANNTDANLLQSDLESLSKWSTDNDLIFNSAKCVLLKFKSRSNNQKKQLIVTDLGINFSVTLQWRPHYDTITAKAYKILGLLRRIFKNSISYEAKKLLYSLVRSCLLYCSSLWQPYLIQDILLLEKVQQRATKVILNDYTSDYKSRLIKLQLLPLMYMYDLSDILFL